MLGDTNELIVGNRNLPVASGGLRNTAEGAQVHGDGGEDGYLISPAGPEV